MADQLPTGDMQRLEVQLGPTWVNFVAILLARLVELEDRITTLEGS